MLNMAQYLKDTSNIWENVPERVEIITGLENEGDAITHLIFRELCRTYVTPFDREDILSLANTLDNVADSICAAANDMLFYKVDRPGNRINELAEVIVQIAAEVETSVSEMRNRINQKQMLERCKEINRLENVADGIYKLALAELFTDLSNMIDIIKWRDILQHLEDAVNGCEDAANVLEGMAIKYS